MHPYSSDRFHKDWVYACAQDLKFVDGPPASRLIGERYVRLQGDLNLLWIAH